MKLLRHGVIAGLVVSATLAMAACGSDNQGGDNKPGAQAPSGDCATGTLNVQGSSAQKIAIEAWIAAYQAKCKGSTITYNANGSGAGIEAFNASTADFAGSDSALKDDQLPGAKARCKSGAPVHLPMVIGPIAVVFNVEGVDKLQLKPATIAGIFSGKIAKWDDAAIKADNPTAKLPSAPIQAVHRSEDSGTTDNFTKYLGKTAPEVWTWPNAKKWPIDGGVGQKGSDGVASAVKSTVNSISYVELGFAETSGLKKAAVQNGAGEFVELTPDAASKTFANATNKGTDTDIKLELDYKTAEKGAYPIVLATYEIVCSAGNGDKAALLKSFLTYTASTAGQAELTKIGYAPLPESVRGKVEAIAKSIA
ncbi:phosphate-binding protein PstS [Actinorhabdospora filicis]|uniref:Phosphate-binding protein n=1 Tax=Actinorhabdospora filicis TaxID=1785913 RepID=A0A9W6STU3_9ACTN|nr:phosphate ABC transporter substrate-binding protein PstS [Actinorhabdospora filicis]GLZ81722.1 phosphate-binding protein PstS [Actinorhabdospora filicis]